MDKKRIALMKAQLKISGFYMIGTMKFPQLILAISNGNNGFLKTKKGLVYRKLSEVNWIQLIKQF